MNIKIPLITALNAALFFLSTSIAAEDSHKYLKSIPAGSLPDPHGKIYTTDGKLTRPVIAIFSVPDWSQGPVQEKWAKQLADDPVTRLPDLVGLYLIEDMSEAMFRETARKEIKKQYNSGDRPVILIDEQGTYRKRFQVDKGETCVLVYDQNNQLRLIEKGKATEAAVKNIRKTVLTLLASQEMTRNELLTNPTAVP
jgi:hypothetical protein